MSTLDALALVFKLLLGLAVLTACVALAQFASNVWTGHQIRRAAAERARRENELVHAQAGALPVAYRSVIDGETLDAAVALLAESVRNQRPMPSVPHTITYSPHMVTKGSNEVQPVEAHPALPAPGDFWQLYSAGQLPKDKFLLGYNLDDGAAVTATWRDLYSALVGGQSGSGKSTLIRCILAQSALQGGRFVVLDKHFQAGEESLGASLLPLRSRLAADVAATEAQMIDALRLVRGVAEARLSGRDNSREPLILIADETTGLLQRSSVADELTVVLGMISQEARKVGVYAFAIGQQWSNEVLSTTVRNSFVSAISCRARRDVARIMSGSTTFGQMAETLTTGQAVWQSPQGNVVKIAIPNTSQAHLDMVASTLAHTAPTPLLEVDPGRTPGQSPGRTPGRWVEDAALDLTLDSTCAALVKQLFVAGTNRAEIIRQVWNVEAKQGGNAFKTATRELDDILRALVR